MKTLISHPTIRSLFSRATKHPAYPLVLSTAVAIVLALFVAVHAGLGGSEIRAIIYFGVISFAFVMLSAQSARSKS